MATPMSLSEMRAMLNKISRDLDLLRRRIDIVVTDLDSYDATKAPRKATKSRKK